MRSRRFWAGFGRLALAVAVGVIAQGASCFNSPPADCYEMVTRHGIDSEGIPCMCTALAYDASLAVPEICDRGECRRTDGSGELTFSCSVEF